MKTPSIIREQIRAKMEKGVNMNKIRQISGTLFAKYYKKEDGSGPKARRLLQLERAHT